MSFARSSWLYWRKSYKTVICTGRWQRLLQQKRISFNAASGTCSFGNMKYQQIWYMYVHDWISKIKSFWRQWKFLSWRSGLTPWLKMGSHRCLYNIKTCLHCWNTQVDPWFLIGSLFFIVMWSFLVFNNYVVCTLFCFYVAFYPLVPFCLTLWFLAPYSWLNIQYHIKV